MELKSFRELLLKKAVDNPTLQLIINVMKDELIIDQVIESLEKMADPQKGAGRSATAAVTAFGQGLTDSDVHGVHDALSHHISHYKSALKNGNREVADKHLNEIIPLMHFITQAGKHSGGKLNLDYTSLRPWEMNYTSDLSRKEAREKYPNLKPIKAGADPDEYHHETEGLDRRLSPGSRDKDATGAEKNPFGVSDWRFLEMPPHPNHKKITHTGGYPFEDIQVGSAQDTKAKKAHLDIDDVPKKDSFTPHPFDSHPALQLVRGLVKQKDLGGKEQDLANSIKQWEDTTAPEREKRLEDKYNKDPEGFESRGQNKPPHHFNDMPLKTMPHHSEVPASGTEDLPEALRPLVKPQASAAPTKAPAGAKSNVDFSALPASLQRFKKPGGQ